jgi:hypothetical protein
VRERYRKHLGDIAGLAKEAEALTNQLADGLPPLALAQALVDLNGLAAKWPT